MPDVRLLIMDESMCGARESGRQSLPNPSINRLSGRKEEGFPT